MIVLYLDGKKKVQDPKSTKYLQKIEHTGTHIRLKKVLCIESVKKVLLFELDIRCRFSKNINRQLSNN